MRVLFEDNHLLAVAKPAGLATMGVEAERDSLVQQAKAYLRDKYNKPGEVYLGVVSRLDLPVSGVLLLARTSKAAARLTAAFKGREVEKRYLACVEGRLEPDEATLEHHLAIDERNRKTYATQPDSPGAQLARLHYRVVARERETSLLEVRLITGRKHQIRVQLAKVGTPVVGDAKYGATRPYKPGIALHAWRLALEHPVRRTPLLLEAPPPKGWNKWFDAEMKEIRSTP
ncbi:RluA family pseudouridine synthase [Botrimarina hoheduenensis]|uniref:tRNA pseudouridine synthase C n=1 Tax=Botrimarina hoheduenensis TaxID=2528000 RepID=A0A5C5VX33_9BACT|nr:RNA pseudouridine synthase [Botrimarina hoheduenensis]TWT42575.1 tRNA pseudouridine synthase C [Botrimarina hoheduenensis]